MKIDYIEKIESSSEVTLEKADLLLLVNTLEQAKEKFWKKQLWIINYELWFMKENRRRLLAI